MTPHPATHALPLLPMHLLIGVNCWLNSQSLPPIATDELPDSADYSKNTAGQQALCRAVAEETATRACQLQKGIQRYRDAPHEPRDCQAPCIWQLGSVRLLDYGQGQIALGMARNVALFVPSLINRYYILDLKAERSMLRYLPAQGVYPIVLDWGTPGDEEKNFDSAAYVAVLLEAIAFLNETNARPVALAGYCMGGVLALAAATRARKLVSSLALFATPWNFHCKEFKPFLLNNDGLPAMRQLLAAEVCIPAELIQSLFYLTDPWVFEHKFRRFARMPEGSEAARDFIALEHWVNDGVPMPARLARDCLIGWAQENRLLRNSWHVDGHAVDPAGLKLPAFLAIAQHDHVVPMECAMPLAQAIPGATVIHPDAGHVSMMVGKRAEKECWQPYVDWLFLTKA